MNVFIEFMIGNANLRTVRFWHKVLSHCFFDLALRALWWIGQLLRMAWNWNWLRRAHDCLGATITSVRAIILFTPLPLHGFSLLRNIIIPTVH